MLCCFQEYIRFFKRQHSRLFRITVLIHNCIYLHWYVLQYKIRIYRLVVHINEDTSCVLSGHIRFQFVKSLLHGNKVDVIQLPPSKAFPDTVIRVCIVGSGGIPAILLTGIHPDIKPFIQLPTATGRCFLTIRRNCFLSKMIIKTPWRNGLKLSVS